jgi:type IV pilus assembly protein PilC
LGKMFANYSIANFSRTLGLLLAGNIGIVQALEITAQTADNAIFRDALEKAAAAVKQGGSLAQAMEKEKAVFPPLVWQMIAAGENSGNLSASLIYLSKIYEDEMNNSMKNLAVSVEPALMVFMGVLVGFVAISIITPIYGITQLLQK